MPTTKKATGFDQFKSLVSHALTLGKGRKKSGIIYSTLLILGLAGVFYYFIFIEIQKDSIIRKKYEVLERVELNLNEKLRNLESLVKISAFCTEEDFPDGLRLISDSDSGIISDEGHWWYRVGDGCQKKNEEERKEETKEQEEKGEGDKKDKGSIYVRLDHLLEPLIPDDVFDGLFVVDNQKVIYGYGKKGLGLKGKIESKIWLPKNDTAIAYNSKTFLISDIRYQSFPHTQKAIKASNGQWLMVGLVKSATINSQAKSINIWLVVVLSLLVLVVVISMPILKVMFINELEPFNSKDVVLSGMSIIIGVSIFFLAILAVWEYSDFHNNELENQLRTLSKDLDESFTMELKEMSTQMDILETEELYKVAKDMSASGKSKRYISVSVADPYPFFNEFLWANKEGKQLGQLTRLQGKPLFNLNERPYFKDIKSGNTWWLNLANRKEEFAFSSVVSWITGKREAVVIKQARRNLDEVAYVAMSSRLNSVLGATMPKPFEFAVMDKSGKVLFHSNSEKNLNENFLQEVGNDRSVEAALFGSNEVFFQNSYWSKRVKGIVTPMKEMPLFIAVYSPLESPRSYVSGIVSFCLIMFSITMLFLGVLTYGTVRIEKHKKSKLNKKIFSFEWVRNRNGEGHKKAYRDLFWLCILYGVALLIQVILPYGSLTTILGVSILLPSSLYILIYWDLELGTGLKNGVTGGNENYGKLLFRLGGTFLLFLVVSMVTTLYSWESTVGVLILFLLTLFLLLKRGEGKIREDDHKKEKELRYNIRIAIFQMVFMALVNVVLIYLLQNPWFLMIEIVLFILGAKTTGLISSIPWLVFKIGKRSFNLGAKWWFLKLQPEKKFYLFFVSAWLVVGHLVPVFANFMAGDKLENLIWNRYQQLSYVQDLNAKETQLRKEYEAEFETFETGFSKSFLDDKVHAGSYRESFGHRLLDENSVELSERNKLKFHEPDGEDDEHFKNFLFWIRPGFKTQLDNMDGLIYNAAGDGSHTWSKTGDKSYSILKYRGSVPGSTDEKGLTHVLSEDSGQKKNWVHHSIFFVIVCALVIGYGRLVSLFNKKLFGEEFCDVNRQSFHFESMKNLRPGTGLIYNVLAGSNIMNVINQARKDYQRIKSEADVDIEVTAVTIELISQEAWEPVKAGDDQQQYYVLEDLAQLREVDSAAILTVLGSLDKVLSSKGCLVVVSTIYPSKLYDLLVSTWPEEKASQLPQFRARWDRIFVMFEELVHAGTYHTQLLEEQKEMKAIDRVVVTSDMKTKFDGIWSSLTNRQRYILVDLAEDGFVNTKSKLAIVSLIRKGLIRYDTDGDSNRFRYISSDFEAYVAHETKQEVGEQIRKEMQQRGIWGGISTSIYIMVIVALIFIAVSEPEYFNDFNSFMALIAGVITLLPTLASLFSVSPENNETD